MKLSSVNITNFKIDGGAMFGVVPKVLRQRTYPADESNLCSWALRSLVVEDGDRVILVDNGFGDKQDAKFLSHFYLFQKYIIMLHLSVKNSSKCRNTTRFHSCDAYSYSIRATVVVCQQPTQTNTFQ